ncbi:MAG: ABC transporter permease [Armatimonadota bacterium]
MAIINWQRVMHVVRKELLQLKRDKKMMGPIFIAPIFQLLVFGYAITADIKNVHTVIVDMDHSQYSRQLTERFRGAGETFSLDKQADSPALVDKLLDSGQSQLAIVIPKGFQRAIGRGETAPVQAILDGSDSKTASLINSYVNAVVSGFSRQRVDTWLRARGSTLQMPLQVRPRNWYNPDMRSVNYMVPGVLCLILMVVTMMLTSLSIVREREIGTLEQIIVTPITNLELMLGKMIPFAIIGMIDVVLILLVSTLWFKVHIVGSIILLLVLTMVFLTATLGLGLFISTVSRTQQQAMMVSFFIMQPSILLSGFMFPVDNMPQAIRLLTTVIPLRYYLEIVRGIFLRGVGIEVLWPQTLALVGLTALLMWGSVKRFVKQVG